MLKLLIHLKKHLDFIKKMDLNFIKLPLIPNGKYYLLTNKK